MAKAKNYLPEGFADGMFMEMNMNGPASGSVDDYHGRSPDPMKDNAMLFNEDTPEEYGNITNEVFEQELAQGRSERQEIINKEYGDLIGEGGWSMDYLPDGVGQNLRDKLDAFRLTLSRNEVPKSQDEQFSLDLANDAMDAGDYELYQDSMESAQGLEYPDPENPQGPQKKRHWLDSDVHPKNIGRGGRMQESSMWGSGAEAIGGIP